jgi:phosphate:Na+ symporter
MVPLVGVVAAVVKKIVPGEEIKIERGVRFLDDRTLKTPAVALGQAKRETIQMARIASEMLKNAEKAFETEDLKLTLTIREQEEAVDELNDAIDRYLMQLSRQDLSRAQTRKLAILGHSITDIERVGDHANNLAELVEQKSEEGLIFPESATSELQSMFKKVRSAYDTAIEVLEKDNRDLCDYVLDIERDVDTMEKEYEENHLKRLKEGICEPVTGPVFVDMLRNLERVSDHASNIASAVLIGF